MSPGAADRHDGSDSTRAPDVPEPPEGTGARFYVSPDGDDDWNGTSPDRSGGDGPFETLERARDAIRERKRNGTFPDGGVTVYLRGGTYSRAEGSFELSERDSGEEGAPVVYRAYEDETVDLIGGVDLDGERFEPVRDQAVRDRLPASSRDEVVAYDLAADGITDYGEIVTSGFNLPRSPTNPELFVVGEPMELARWPNEGWTRVGEVHDPGGRPRDLRETFTERPLPDAFDEGSTFEYDGDRPETWTDVEDVWMHGYWWNDYAMSNLRIAELDEGAGTITAEQAHHYSVRSGQRYYFYNVLDELDVPGEFYIDREAGVLYLYPPEPVEEATVQLSLLEEPIVSVRGATNVVFRDLHFGVGRGTGVMLTECSDCLVHGCTIRKVGLMGVVVGDDASERKGGHHGGTNNGVVDCEIYDTGMGGVKLGGGDRESLSPGGNYAIGNDVHDYSRIQPTYTPAVWATGVGNRIARNHLHHAPHQAILLGGNEHVVEYNDIHHVVQETADAGAIYRGRDWTERGIEIRHNYFHHIENDLDPYGIGQIGVYLDDLHSDTVIEGNVFYKVYRPFSIGGGRDNVVRNNLIVDCEHSIDLDDRGLDEDWPHCKPGGVMRDRLEAMPYRDEPWRSAYPELLSLLEDEPCVPKDNEVACNVIVSAPRETVADVARETGTVEDNLAFEFDVEEDPGFVDEGRRNFALEPDSTVHELLECFEEIPFAEMEADAKGPNYAIDPSDVAVTRVDDSRHEIAITVHNTGRETAPPTDVLVVDVTSGDAVGTVRVETIRAFGSAAASLEWETGDLPDGDRELRVVVDPDDEVDELTGSTNEATSTVRLPVYSTDLSIASTYGTTVSERTVRLTVVVENAGTVESDPTRVRLLDASETEPIADLEVPPVAPGRDVALTHDLDADRPRDVRAVLDPDDELHDRETSTDASTVRIGRLEPLPEGYETYASTGSLFGSRDGRLVVDAAGSDVWKHVDDYGALYRSGVYAEDETTAVVKVVSQEDTDPWAKAGLLIRNDVTGAGDATGYAAVMVTPDNGFEFEWDGNANGYLDTAENTGESTHPCWLKLERRDSSFAGYYSTDGETWTEVGTTDLLGVAPVQDVAVFALSHDATEYSTVEFDEFEVRSPE